MVTFCIAPQPFHAGAVDVVAYAGVVKDHSLRQLEALVVLDEDEQVKVGFCVFVAGGNRAIHADELQRTGADLSGFGDDCIYDSLIDSDHCASSCGCDYGNSIL